MSLSARAIAALVAFTAASAAFFALLLGTGKEITPATAQGVPSATSDNVKQLTTVPDTRAISGVFSRSAPFFYVSGLDAIQVLDVSNPKAPERVGRLNNAIFENEAMTLGERRLADGTIQRFLLVGNDLVQASAGPGGVQRGRVGGGELIIVDVTDPAAPAIVGRVNAGTSTHTVACMNAPCTVAYSAGDGGEFSIFDLTDIKAPKLVTDKAKSPAAGPNPVFSGGSGHHWQVDGAGLAAHAGSGGTAIFDITDPLKPQAIEGTDANGTKSPYNDFIHHNVQRPNAQAFKAGQAPSVANGNVALITEEDYFNDGDEIECSKAGTFQTWEVPSLDGAAYQANNPKNEPNKGSIRPLDTINAPAESQGGLSTPIGGFCSAHWFDYHQSGTVAIGFYQQGLRLLSVRDAKDIKQTGFATGGGSEVWDAYWAPQRDASGTAVPGKKTNLVYTVDAIRGVEVFEVTNLPPDLPVTGDAGERGAFPAAPGRADETPAAQRPGAGSGAGAGASRCGLPTSQLARSARLSRTGLRLGGTARGQGCRVTKVRVAVGRKVGSQCRFLQANGRFSARRSCLRTSYLSARGTSTWTLRTKGKLPRGSYLVWSRAIDSAGQIERKASSRNLLRTRLR